MNDLKVGDRVRYSGTEARGGLPGYFGMVGAVTKVYRSGLVDVTWNNDGGTGRHGTRWLTKIPFVRGEYVTGLGISTGTRYYGEYGGMDDGNEATVGNWACRADTVESVGFPIGTVTVPPSVHALALSGAFDETHLWKASSGAGHLSMTNADDPAPKATPTKRAEVLREAERITATDRNSSYGEPEDNFARIAAFWNVYLQDKLKPGEQISAGDTAALVIMIKLAREMNAPKEDNKIDIAGYAACWAEVDHQEREQDK